MGMAREKGKVMEMAMNHTYIISFFCSEFLSLFSKLRLLLLLLSGQFSEDLDSFDFVLDELGVSSWFRCLSHVDKYVLERGAFKYMQTLNNDNEME